MPLGLDVDERRLWRRLVPILAQQASIRVQDRAAIEDYIRGRVLLQRLRAYIKENGMSYMTDVGMRRPHPEVAQAMQVEKMLRELEDRFMMNPKARRVNNNGSEKDKAGAKETKTALTFVKHAGSHAATG